MTEGIKWSSLFYQLPGSIMFGKIALLQIQQRVVEPVNPSVFFFQSKVILYLIILCIHPAGDFIGNTQKFGAVKAVVADQKPEGYHLQKEEGKKGSVPAEE